MAAIVIDGKTVAQQVRAQCKIQAAALLRWGSFPAWL